METCSEVQGRQCWLREPLWSFRVTGLQGILWNSQGRQTVHKEHIIIPNSHTVLEADSGW